jgi:DNA polymerase I-like protein with 3'-5' exonuclease and polymerase domains
VYDIINAGPNHRFTIQGERAPFVVSNCVQSSGHDLLDIYNLIVMDMLSQAKLTWYPWHIDIHDCMAVECPDGTVEEVKDIMLNKAFSRLNEMLEPRIPLRGDANVCKNLWDDKREDDIFLSNWKQKEIDTWTMQ